MPRSATLQIENAELPALERRILAEQLDDRFGIGSLLELGEHQHLVLVRAVDARLARRDTLAGHDDGLDAREELVVAIDARRRRDHNASGAAIDGNHRPRCRRRRRQGEQRRSHENKDSAHGGMLADAAADHADLIADRGSRG